MYKAGQLQISHLQFLHLTSKMKRLDQPLLSPLPTNAEPPASWEQELPFPSGRREGIIIVLPTIPPTLSSVLQVTTPCKCKRPRHSHPATHSSVAWEVFHAASSPPEGCKEGEGGKFKRSQIFLLVSTHTSAPDTVLARREGRGLTPHAGDAKWL